MTLESNNSRAVSRLTDPSGNLPNITGDSKTVRDTRTNVPGQEGVITDNAPVCNTLRVKTYADVVRGQRKQKRITIRSPDGNL